MGVYINVVAVTVVTVWVRWQMSFLPEIWWNFYASRFEVCKSRNPKSCEQTCKMLLISFFRGHVLIDLFVTCFIPLTWRSLCSLDRLPSFPSLRSFIAAGNEPGFTCWNLASLSNDAGLHLPCALVEKMEGTRETLPRDGLKPSHFYVDMSDDLDFLDHIDVELYQNEKMHVHFLLPCFAVRKGFTLWSKLFFRRWIAEIKLQALFGPSIQLKHSTLSGNFQMKKYPSLIPQKWIYFPSSKPSICIYIYIYYIRIQYTIYTLQGTNISPF